MMDESLYLRAAIIDNLAPPTKAELMDLETTLGFQIDGNFADLLSKTNNGRFPRAGYLVANHLGASSLVRTTAQESIVMRVHFFGIGKECPAGDHFKHWGFEDVFSHFDTKSWWPIGRTGANSYLNISTDGANRLSVIYVHEHSKPPEVIDAHLDDLVDGIYIQLSESDWLDLATEEQCEFFFAGRIDRVLKSFFHMRCLGQAPNDFISNAIDAELPLVDLKRIVAEKHQEVTKKNARGDALIHVAANNGRIDAISLLLESGSDLAALDKDEKTAFSIALNNANYRFARKLVQLGYRPDARADVLQLQRPNLAESDRNFALCKD